jgi:RNA polymerase sigma-70 factor (ECF subfamily)
VRNTTRVLIGARTTMAEIPVGESLAEKRDVQRGDAEKAVRFQRLADENLDASYRLARVILGSRTEAEDAVHDAFEIAWRKWASLRDPARFEAWFQRIVVNTCRDRLRKTSRRRESDISTQLTPVAPDAYGAFHERERMSRAFMSLDADHRIVLALRYYRDLTVDDIAVLTGVRSGTVKSRLHRAQEHMRDILSSQGTAP